MVDKHFNGKTVIITCANTGIGKETALDLAKRGACVVLACRDQKKTDDAASEIKSVSGNENVVVELLDLASLDSVRQFAKRINQNEPYVNILVNNAGLLIDGFEMSFGVNHLGHFLLTNLLLEKLQASAPSRIVNLSSAAYRNGGMNWDDFMFEKDYQTLKVYSQSKLANVLFTRELSKRLPNGITTYALHPGVVNTELFRKTGPLWKVLFGLFRPVVWLAMKTPKQGGKCTNQTRLDGKTVIITGANTGIGKETALDLEKRGARVILACRDQFAKRINQNEPYVNVLVNNAGDLCLFKSREP